MRLDHLAYAAGPEGIAETSRRLGGLLGEALVDGGVHPRFGTRNTVLPLEGGVYLEVVGVLDHPASEKAVFGQVVRARTEAGGGWLGWVVAVDDMSAVESRLGRAAVHGSRHRPDGFELRWQQLGVSGLQAEPQLPFFVRWEIEPQEHPSHGASGAIRLSRLEIAGDPTRVSEWLDEDPAKLLEDVDVEWVEASGFSGLVAATFDTPGGPVRF